MNFKKWLCLENNRYKLILYHGSYDKINKFKISEYLPRTDWGYFGLGVYLTPNPLLAKHYGPNVHECEVDLSNPLLWSRSKEELYDEYPTKHEKGTRIWAKTLTESMIKDGHDGIIKIQPGSGMGLNRISEVCVFDPDNVMVLNQTWNIEGSEEIINKLRKGDPFFSQKDYDKFNNNWK